MSEQPIEAFDDSKRVRPSRRTVWSLFFALLIIYHANGKPMAEVDCVAAPYTVWSLVRHGSADLTRYTLPPYEVLPAPALRQTTEGELVSMRPLGSTLAAFPVFAPVALFREEPLSSMAMLQLGKLTAALYSALAAVFFFLICRRLTPTAAWPSTLLFALGTTLWPVASQALWAHGPAICAMCAGLFLLMCEEKSLTFRRGAVVGLLLGLAIFSRPPTVFFALALGAVSLIQRRWRLSLGLLLGGAIPVGVTLVVNSVWFGHPFLGGYHRERWDQPADLMTGLSGLLIAPSRGLLVYTPALLLIPLGCVTAWRRLKHQKWIKGLILACVAGAWVTLLLYARWVDWRGGWCYGPRLLIETMPICCLLFGFAYTALRPRWRWIGLALVLISISVHFLGVAAGRKAYCDWQARHSFDDGGRSLFSWEDTQIEAHARGFWMKISKLVR